jgi:hypothetical protein
MIESDMKCVVFDTCTIRAIIHGCADAIAEWQKIMTFKDKMRFRIGDVALAEITLALGEERIHWTDWKNRVMLINDLLDDEIPILPGHRELEQLRRGIANEEPGGIRFSKAIWHHISSSNSETDLQKETSFTGEDGQVYLVKGWDLSRAAGIIERDRDYWADSFDDIKAKAGSLKLSEEQTVTIIAEELDNKVEIDPPLSVVLDAQIRSRARFVYLSLNNKEPYNPRSKKRRGDFFDFTLLACLGLPAVICTRDHKFKTHVDLTKSYQSDQIMLPVELIDWLAKL